MSSTVTTIEINNELETEKLAQSLVSTMPSQSLICYFEGPLGVGKSALIRSMIRSLGVVGAIKSPTFSVIETYDAKVGEIAHLDLYRLSDDEELYFLGFEDIVAQAALILVEWPSRCAGLPAPDLLFELSFEQSATLKFGEARKVSIQSNTCAGENWLHRIIGA